ncbi:cytochrome P450 [Ideonella sp. B508-1]|uniref:cytochrome P450 n=1 Tax=Ideonella sp. B508-1 TaxID=137716 RepID=UPI000346CE30|nr:cytochrome P450 [Ideonella sp. B508-1]
MHALAERPQHVAPDRVVDFDYLAPEGHDDDVHRAWSALHRPGLADILWTPHYGGHWIATRADDIDLMQQDHTRFSMSSVTIPRQAQTFRVVPLEMDPPEHTPFRALLSPKFGPRPVHDLEGSVRELAIELIDKVIARGECDFVDAFAKRLPIVVFLRLVNLPLEDRDLLLEMTEASVRGNAERRNWAAQQLQQYIGKWIVARRQHPESDLISAMVNARVAGREYTPEETFGMMINVIFGGLDTVAASMGFAARYLAQTPALRRTLAADPTLIPGAIEEFLRRFGVPNTARVITHDFEYKGVSFKAGEQIILSKTLHGLDERRYPEPLTVDLGRPSSRHAAFGDGPHRCPGAGLARMELRVFLEEWLRRIPEFEITPGKRAVTSSGQVNGILALPLSWSVA